MDWAHRTYFMAKYGMDLNRMPEVITLAEDPSVPTSVRWKDGLQISEAGLEDMAIPGSNDRLRQILTTDDVVTSRCRYDPDALIHSGPDGTMVLTNAAGWGIPILELGGYAELDARFTCCWEVSRASWVAQMPWWARV